MNYKEFDDQFDVYFNNITSNLAAGLNTYEKSVILTKAQNEIVKNHFTANSKGNNILQGFDDSAIRQADFSCLMKTKNCQPGEKNADSMNIYNYIAVVNDNYIPIDNLRFSDDEKLVYISGGTYNVSNNNITYNNTSLEVKGLPEGCSQIIVAVENLGVVYNKIDKRSQVFYYPDDVFIPINETIKCTDGKYLQIVPLRYDEYLRLMSKPYKRPVKYLAWRLINTGVTEGNKSIKNVEIIIGPMDVIDTYTIRYVRFPKPIIIGPLDGLTIDGHCFTEDGTPEATPTEGCELDPIIHEEILQRAVEIAKAAWVSAGNDNIEAITAIGQRSE